MNEKCQTQNPSFCHHVQTGIKMTERRTKPATPPTHTLFSLVCYESITNPFIACSRRIALRDNALKGYRAAADAQLQCGSASLDKASTSCSLTSTLWGQPWNQSCMAAASLASLWHCYKRIQGPFICKVKTIPQQLEGASRKGQINVAVNMHKEKCDQRPAGVDKSI